MYWRTFYAMKSRLGGQKSSPRHKLCWHWYPCPGCQLHKVSARKREILFEHFHNRPQKSWLVYWRSHPTEFNEIRVNIK
jgi:hypothetical protein